MGILSLIFWSLVLIVTVKYVMLIMRADNRGEGGILALMALAQRVSVGTGIRNALTLVGIAGACLFFGDGVITPAISVLSAVEGLEVSTPELAGIRAADQRRGHRRAVRRAVARHRQRRPRLRPGDGGVVRRDRRPRPAARSCAHPFVLLAISPQLRGRAVHPVQGAGVHRARRGGAVRHRGRGAVRRHGPFRRAPDPADLDVLRAALAWC